MGVGERVAFSRDVILLTSTRHRVRSDDDDRPMVVRLAAVAQSLVLRGRQACCGLRGHDLMLHFESNRLALRCSACGAETPGWRLDVSPHLRLLRPRIVTRVTVQPEEAASRSSRDRQEPDASSPRAA